MEVFWWGKNVVSFWCLNDAKGGRAKTRKDDGQLEGHVCYYATSLPKEAKGLLANILCFLSIILVLTHSTDLIFWNRFLLDFLRFTCINRSATRKIMARNYPKHPDLRCKMDSPRWMANLVVLLHEQRLPHAPAQARMGEGNWEGFGMELQSWLLPWF